MNLRTITTLLVSVLFICNVYSKHIIGGVMSYECLGNNQYKITLKIYRDCAGGGAGFDNQAQIGIYRCGTNINCMSLGQQSAFLEPNPTVIEQSDIDPPFYPCLKVPPTVCVQEGIYQFIVTLPKSNESYFIVYQRCCRNNTIDNIVNPEDTGATFEIEITPAAQTNCNSSPVFNFFPPTLICANELLNFDHSASDADGDQLVYSLCAPLVGGGPEGGNIPGNNNGCNGLTPSPACPPPFTPVQYILPNYSYDKPLGQNSPINIDPFTGKLTAKPGVIGQFVVGVCVSEYRNGVLLSTVRRDFQFNVANCQANVTLDIQKDKVVGVDKFIINSCGNKTINFINKSAPKAEIFQYEWNFPDGTPKVVNTANATITFPTHGTFKGLMIINGSTQCADTAIVFVNIYPDLKADFNFAYDTCKAEPVAFKDISNSEGGPIQNWVWSFGDQGMSNFKDPAHKYNTPGLFPVKLRIIDINGCTDSITKSVNYYPVPPLILIQPSTFLGCVPASIKFTNLSTPINTKYDVIWQFGDGETANAVSPIHVYKKDGVYTINIDITSPIGCKTSEEFKDFIAVEPAPVADFDFTPSNPSNIEPLVQFRDLSTGGVSWGWEFGDGGKSFIQNPSYTYPDTGVFTVKQYVIHKSGCIDTLSKIIDVRPVINYFLPNAFSPNGDGINDEFKGMGIFYGMDNFEMAIWDRWGDKIFETKDPAEGWLGRVNNTGNFVQPGIYVCTIKYEGPRKKHYELKGFATVIR